MCLHCVATKEVGYFGPDYEVRTQARAQHKALQEQGLCEACNLEADRASIAVEHPRPQSATADR